MVVCRWSHCSGWDAEMLADAFHFSTDCGPGCWGWGGCCFPACTALQPSLLLRLPEFWLDRYENNFKNHTTVYSNPELMALFCLTGKDKETTTPAKAQAAQSVLHPNGETLSSGMTGERGEPGSSSRRQDLRSPRPHIPQSLGLASAESVWWPGLPCQVRYCTRGAWAAEHFRAHP